MLKFVALLLVLVGTLNIAQAQKFGYINSAELLTEMPEVKQAEANLDALQKQLQKKLQGSVEQLQKDYVEIQQKIERGELSPKQQEEEAAKLKGRETALAQEEQDMVKQIQAKRTELLEPIYKRVNDAIATVAKENGFTFIFDEQVLLYMEESQNVSALVKSKLGI